jgi:hypothetical protein
MSPLLRLPAELRNEIYAYVFTDEYMFASITCSTDAIDRDYGPIIHTCINKPYRVALTSTCRALHAETQNLPFKLNEFSFESMRSFKRVALLLSPTQCALITQVSIADEISDALMLYFRDLKDVGYHNLVDLLPNAHTVVVKTCFESWEPQLVADAMLRLSIYNYLCFWAYEPIYELVNGSYVRQIGA